MSTPKMIMVGALSLFALIGAVALVKKGMAKKGEEALLPLEVVVIEESEPVEKSSSLLMPVRDELAEQEVDEVSRLFTTGKRKFPIVETIRYRSRVPWLEGKMAWIADYATYYATSRHFIARSLNGKRDYETQKVSFGDYFNVFRKDKNIQFYGIIDLSRCKMWFYYYDVYEGERVLLKTYRVGLGRFNSESDSGLLTPQGKFLLGEKIALFRPGVKGYFQEQETELIQVFGTRWIPFDQEVSGEGVNPKGYGIHGAPWIFDEENQTYRENREVIGTYESDGCIRLLKEDIEEFFAIVITKPTTIEIVSDFKEAHPPGIEVQR